MSEIDAHSHAAKRLKISILERQAINDSVDSLHKDLIKILKTIEEVDGSIIVMEPIFSSMHKTALELAERCMVLIKTHKYKRPAPRSLG